VSLEPRRQRVVLFQSRFVPAPQRVEDSTYCTAVQINASWVVLAFAIYTLHVDVGLAQSAETGIRNVPHLSPCFPVRSLTLMAHRPEPLQAQTSGGQFPGFWTRHALRSRAPRKHTKLMRKGILQPKLFGAVLSTPNKTREPSSTVSFLVNLPDF
jgi:hypothetical protein